MTYICARCGKLIDFKNVEGSLKHPLHKKCFYEDFDSMEDYGKFLDEKLGK